MKNQNEPGVTPIRVFLFFIDLLTSRLALLFFALLCLALQCFAALYFPAQRACVLFTNTIHIPLSVQYTRRLVGASRGGLLDMWFAMEWLMVVCARAAMLVAQSALGFVMGSDR